VKASAIPAIPSLRCAPARPVEVERAGLQGQSVVDPVVETLAPVQIDRVEVDPRKCGADHPGGCGFILADKTVHERLVHVMPMRSEGRHSGHKGDAFGVDQCAVKVEENGVVHRGLRGGAIADQRCSR
jgi:hypothetical protein